MLQHVQTLQKQQPEVTKFFRYDRATDMLLNVVYFFYNIL